TSAAVGIARLESAGINNASVRAGAESEFAAFKIIPARTHHAVVLNRKSVNVAVRLQFCRCGVDGAGVVDPGRSPLTAGSHRYLRSASMIDHHVAAGAESHNPARSVHFTGVLEKVAHEDYVAALTG